MSAETEIRELIAGWTEAARSRDVERIMSCYATDVWAYDRRGKALFDLRPQVGLTRPTTSPPTQARRQA